MKAAVCTKYGEPQFLRIVDLKKPKPGDNEIVVKINASSVSSGDARIRRADPFVIRFIFGWKRPRKSVLGVVVAGEVEAVGKDVTKYNVGDRVFGSAGMQFGAHAEYQSIPEDAVLTLIPEGMSYNEAAAIPFGATAALHFLRKGAIQKNKRVLIYGASGAIGTIAVQISKYYGANVTAVCSRHNFSLMEELGADHVVDYTQEDFTKKGVKYDIIFDTVGKSSFGSNIKSLKNDGSLLLASAGFGQMIRGGFTTMLSAKKVCSGIIKETAEDMGFIKSLIEKKALRPVIDTVYSLDDIAMAHARVDGGHKTGNVIIEMNHQGHV